MLEFAISAALFFMLIFGAIIWSLTMWQVNTLQHAVERGTRCAILPVAPSGGKQCGDYTVFAANNAVALSTVNSTNFSGGNQTFTFTPAPTLYAAPSTGSLTSVCVNTTNVMNPFAVAPGLLKAGPSIGSVTYCRPKQS